eukprot:3703622-Pyramimonas_sp.AAC.1
MDLRNPFQASVPRSITMKRTENVVSSISPTQATKFGGPKITLSGTFLHTSDIPVLKFQYDNIETVMVMDEFFHHSLVFVMKRFNLPSGVSSADVKVLLALNGRDFEDTGFTFNVISAGKVVQIKTCGCNTTGATAVTLGTQSNKSTRVTR